MDANKVLALGGFRCDEDAEDRVPHLANVTDTNCGDVFEDAWVLQVSVPPDAMATVAITGAPLRRPIAGLTVGCGAAGLNWAL